MKVDIPCKIGDEVFAIKKYNGAIKAKKGRISQMYFVGNEMRLAIVVNGIARGEWGVSVFATESEALDKISQKCYNKYDIG